MIKGKLLLYFMCCPIFCMTAYKIHLSSAWYPEKKSNLLLELMEHEQYAALHYDANLDHFKIRAIIVPHAGLKYSGDVASSAYRLLPINFFKRIIVLAPSHHEFFEGVGLPSNSYDSYKSPIGTIALDKYVLNSLEKEKELFIDKSHVHELEHSINIQIPFIQNYCGHDCKLVPLLVGEITIKQAKSIASILGKYIDDKTLVVISSDFVHYGPRFSYEPFKNEDNVHEHIGRLDSDIVAKIQEQNLNGFDQILKKTGATVCGQNPIKILLAIINENVFDSVDSYIVGYDKSDHSVKNPEHSVSYVSCIVSNELKNKDEFGKIFLTRYEKEMLLKISRDILKNVIDNVTFSKKSLIFSGLLTKSLKKMTGAFVTLYKIDKNGYKYLRGCIGNIVGTKPLYETVYDMTIAAALSDKRFTPVDKQELPYIDISISVLSQPKKVFSYRDIVINRDGVILKNKEKSSVYLPNVAVDQGWNLQQMLESLCIKAGLSTTAWQDKNSIFQTFVSNEFAENKDPLEFMYEGYKK